MISWVTVNYNLYVWFLYFFSIIEQEMSQNFFFEIYKNTSFNNPYGKSWRSQMTLYLFVNRTRHVVKQTTQYKLASSDFNNFSQLPHQMQSKMDFTEMQVIDEHSIAVSRRWQSFFHSFFDENVCSYLWSQIFFAYQIRPLYLFKYGVTLKN